MLTKEQRSEITKDWIKFSESGDLDITNDDVSAAIVSAAGYFLNVIDEQLARKVGEMKKEIEEGIAVDDGIHPATGMPEYKDFNKGVTAGWNDCRSQVLNLVSSLSANDGKKA